MFAARGQRETTDSKRVACRIGEDMLVVVLNLDRFVHGSDMLTTELAEEGALLSVVCFV